MAARDQRRNAVLYVRVTHSARIYGKSTEATIVHRSPEKRQSFILSMTLLSHASFSHLIDTRISAENTSIHHDADHPAVDKLRTAQGKGNTDTRRSLVLFHSDECFRYTWILKFELYFE